MKVYIVNFRGTNYGVFSTEEKASMFANLKFGRNAVMSLDVTISAKELDAVTL